MPFEVPDALRGLSGSERWVAWDDVGGRKVPKSPGGGNAKSNDPSTWGSLADAEAAAERCGYSGVGIELGDGLVGIDLDGCVRDGAIEPWAQEIVDAIGSYTEVSPSGTGVHILAYADPRTTGVVGRADHRRGIEVYNHGRYFTVTGKQVGDSGIADRTDEVASLVSERFPSESRESSFSRQVARLARDQVARRANETTSFNVGRDARRGARFARVPMGAHACQFCLMLASRGFVYHNAKTAGEFAHYHSDCRCKVVAGFPEMTYYYKNGVKVSRGTDPTVEGYDPDAYFKEYELRRDVESMRKAGSLAVAGDLTRNPDGEEMRRNAVQMRRAIRKRVQLWDGSPSDARDLFGETGSSRVDGDMAEALTYLPKSWVEELAKSGVMVVSVDETSSGRSQFAGGKTVEILEGDSNELAIVHELVHAMDQFDSGFRARDEEFFRGRTTGKHEKQLSKLTNNEMYSAKEYAYEVDDAYSYYAYKDYRGSAYETSSMGIQFLYGDPVGLRERDPKLFAFAIRQLLEVVGP